MTKSEEPKKPAKNADTNGGLEKNPRILKLVLNVNMHGSMKLKSVLIVALEMAVVDAMALTRMILTIHMNRKTKEEELKRPVKSAATNGGLEKILKILKPVSNVHA